MTNYRRGADQERRAKKAGAYATRRMQIRERERLDRERRWHTTDAPED